MSKTEKRLARMRNNPRGDWILDDLVSLAQRYGIAFKSQVGSHATFSHPSVPEILTVPARRPIKPIYIKDFVALIDKITAAESSDED